jgi:hypothetical protein
MHLMLGGISQGKGKKWEGKGREGDRVQITNPLLP